MRLAGYLLIAAGFLAGAWAAVQRVEGVPWSWYLPALAAGVLGVVLVQLGRRAESREAGTVAANLEAATGALGRLAEGFRRLDAEKGEIPTYEMRHVIDRRFLADLDAFVEARQAIAHRLGLQVYADVMSAFANGERYLNRAWSASADGYVDEVELSIARAADEMSQARDELARAAGG